MTLKLTIGWALVALAVLTVGGCGTTGAGASAPPISLPAPVTGRMTIASPDEGGVALVVGDEGAVPAGSVVHAINGSKETVTFRVFDTLLGLIPSAYAQTPLPEVCSRTFHACALADDTGSFEISIPAEPNEEIVVEIIDPTTGSRISERLHRPVSPNTTHFGRAVSDLGLLHSFGAGDHWLYVLMPRTVDAPLGRVTVVDPNSGVRTPFPFDGPHPARIAVHQVNAEAIINDPEGGFFAKVDLETNNFAAPTNKVSVAAIRDVHLSSNQSTFYVTTSEPDDTGSVIDARVIRSFNFNTLVEGDPIRLSFLQGILPEITANSETLALDIRNFIDGLINLDLGVFFGTYATAGGTVPVLGLFNATNMLLVDAVALPVGTVPEDVAFTKTTNQILVTDSGNDQILLYDFTYAAGVGTLTAAGAVTDPSGGLITNPRDIAFSTEGTFAFITAKNGTPNHEDTVLTVNMILNTVVDFNPVGLGPSGIVFDPLDDRVFVSGFKSHSVTVWDLPELLP